MRAALAAGATSLSREERGCRVATRGVCCPGLPTQALIQERKGKPGSRGRFFQIISAFSLAAAVGMAGPAQAQDQKQIIAGWASIVRSLDPATQIAGEEGSLNWVTYDNLVTFDRQDFNKIAPSLAETWEISPDGKVLYIPSSQGGEVLDR